MKINSFLSSVFFMFTLYISAQTGSITGNVSDSTTKETIPGVKVMLEGQSKGAFTDLDGKYVIGGLSAGTYSVSFKYDTYKTKLIPNIVVKDGEATNLTVVLSAAIQDIGPIEFVHTIEKESITNLLVLQRNNASVIDGISGDQIKKSVDSKASDVLKRVSGASVQDNKFVVIRGLSDRYNFALINGASLPSSESDRKAFSFDIFPSNMLDNLIIMKTATPELPGEFAGGVIDISTIEPKDKNFQSIQLSGAYNTLTTFKDFARSERGGTDFLGFGAGSRQIPDGIPTTTEYTLLTKNDKAELAKQMDFGWGKTYSKALPSGSIQYSLGRSYKLKKDDQFGFVFAYSYQNNFNTSTLIRREFEEQAAGVVTKMELNDSVFTQTILNTGLLNFSYKFNSKNKIQFKNLYSVNSEDKVNSRRGVRELDNDPRQWEKSTNYWYTQNNLLTSQLMGNHEFKKSKFNWNLGFSNVKREVPNLRRSVYRKYSLLESDTVEQYVAVIQSNGTIPTAAGNMFWSNSNESIGSLKYDYSIPFGKNDTNKVELKIGGMHQYRARDFASRNFGFSQYKPNGSSFNSQLLLLPEDEIFAQENLGLLDNGQGGFKLDEASSVDDSYQASSFLNAGFLMADATIAKKLRLIGGARVESYNQQFNYIEFGSNQERNIDSTVTDILPSLNLVYSLTKKMNIRASYYKTVSRPEFRELAPFAFYNFVMDNILSGNPNLKRATINNFDLRYEYYPGEGQIFSVSGFYKQFTNPIELVNRTGTSGAPELYYTNVPTVTNIGGELEYRLNLGFVNKEDTSVFWDNMTLYTNMSLIRSKVDLSEITGSGESRPLQGQSPYIINAGAIYNHPTQDWSVSASYNLVGQRIYIVGNVQEPSVWENGRNVIDLQFAKTFNERFEFKLNVKDLLAQDLVFFQDLNGNQKFDNEKLKDPIVSADPNTDNKYASSPDNVWQEVTFGQTVTVSLKYNFGIDKKKTTPLPLIEELK
ncbi:MAG: TonB-dependent receptor [Crocinitomicaceae bacterium]|nr:TonB-dependent receptor [Crocinitomicaceae bacterium]